MDIKEKPKAGRDSPKSRAAPVIDSKQAAKLLKDKYVKELEQRPESESVDAQAAEQVQDAGTWAVDEIVSRPIPRQKKQTIREKSATPHHAADRPTAEPPAAPAGESGMPCLRGREVGPPQSRGCLYLTARSRSVTLRPPPQLNGRLRPLAHGTEAKTGGPSSRSAARPSFLHAKPQQGAAQKITSVLPRKGRFPHGQGQKRNKLHRAPLQ